MVEFVNCFEVAPGTEDEFFARWLEVNAYMREKPGYLGHTLMRSLAPDARFRFVNQAQWESVEAWRAAHDEGFRARVAGAGFVSTPALYEIVHEGVPASA